MGEKDTPDWRLLVDVRKIINSFWNSPVIGFRGRCWGLKHDGANPQKGTHITLGNEQNVVTIFQDSETGALIMQEFIRAERTPLGDKIRQILIDNNLI